MKQKKIGSTKCKNFGLTTDIWTSGAIHGYMTVTVHFVDESWQLYSKILVTEEMPDRHTGQHITGSPRLLLIGLSAQIR